MFVLLNVKSVDLHITRGDSMAQSGRLENRQVRFPRGFSRTPPVSGGKIDRARSQI